MKIKIIYGSDIRRWHYPSSYRYAALVDFVMKTFSFPDEGTFYLQFEDDEGDRVTLSSEGDFEEAMAIATRENRKSLKVFLMRGSIEQAQPSSVNQSFVSSEWDENIASVPSSVDQFEVLSQAEVKNAVPQEKPVENEIEAEIEAQEDIREERCWREMYRDFLANETITQLIPQLIQAIMSDLRSNPNGPLEKVLISVLEQPKFAPIANHSLFVEKVIPNLGCVAAHASQFVPVLLAFNDDMISSIIPQILQTVDQILSGWSDLELDVTPLFASLFPSWIAMMNANAPPQGCQINLANLFGTNTAQETAQAMMSDESDFVHPNVACDVCDMCPIRGPRFKCCVCSNYDMCASCEAKGSHTRTHPLLKIIEPCQIFPRGRMHGIREMFRFGRGWRGCRGGGFGADWFGGGGHRHRSHSHHGHHGHHGHGFEDQHCSPFQWGSRSWNRFSNENPHSHHSNCKSKKLKAEFEADGNIPDRSSYPMNTVLEKLWRMRNSGDVEWGNDCELVFVKGNKSLSMEESFPVPNAQPGQIVEVSAKIKTPNETGRFCTYYRLQRNGTKFGPRVWVDIFVIDPQESTRKINKKERKQQKKIKKLENKRQKLQTKLQRTSQKLDAVKAQTQPTNPREGSEMQNVQCLCGTTLVKIMAHEAYGSRASVYCDLCGKYLDREVFHCPSNKIMAHPDGYDLCTSCVELQMRSLASRAQLSGENSVKEVLPEPSAPLILEPSAPVEPEIVEIADEPKDVLDDEKEPNEEPNDEPIEPVVISIPKDDEIGNENVENPQATEVPHAEDEDNDFKYKKQLQDLKAMGFNNVEDLKYLLTQCDGQTERVLQRLFDA